MQKIINRIGEGDTGLNTGGMGCVSPVPFADNAFMNKVEEKIINQQLKVYMKKDLNTNGFIIYWIDECKW